MSGVSRRLDTALMNQISLNSSSVIRSMSSRPGKEDLGTLCSEIYTMTRNEL